MTAAALPGSRWALSVDPATSSLAEVRKFVERVAVEAELGSEKTFDLKVAVSEACANAVEHAGCESRPLRVSAHLKKRRLIFVIKDDGLFRPPSYTREDCGNRGLGLPLMVTLMDEVNFAKTPDGGTEVTLSLMLRV